MLEVHKAAVRGVVDPHAQLVALALATRSWARAHVGPYALMSRVPPDNAHPEFAPILQDTLDLFARPLGQLGVALADQVHAIRGLRAAVHGFVLLDNEGRFALEEDPAESFRWMVDAVLRGMQR